jgi:exodeoxyribonuclease VII small subunit
MANHEDQTDADSQSLTFEQSLASLEGIINQIEGGEIGLEASLAAYQKGEQLIHRCRELLFQAEQRIETIRLDDLPSGEDADPRS